VCTGPNDVQIDWPGRRASAFVRYDITLMSADVVVSVSEALAAYTSNTTGSFYTDLKANGLFANLTGIVLKRIPYVVPLSDMMNAVQI
jgi:hypothetical protein